jgi:hypothetical protein
MEGWMSEELKIQTEAVVILARENSEFSRRDWGNSPKSRDIQCPLRHSNRAFLENESDLPLHRPACMEE